MKFAIKWLVPLVLGFTGLVEGVHYSVALMNVAFDGAVLGGAVLLCLTIGFFISFGNWYIKRILKAHSVEEGKTA